MQRDPIKSAERDARAKESVDKAFASWLAQPMVRMGLSMVPAGENKDALQMLLRSAFDAGVNCGQGQIAVEMLEAIFTKDRDQR